MRKAILVFVIGVLLSVSALAAAVKVDCNNNEKIGAALSQLSTSGPNTIIVYGTCTEQVKVQYFDRLTIIGATGATIVAPSTVTGATAVTVQDARNVVMNNLTFRGNGTNGALAAVWFMNCQGCRVENSTIERRVLASSMSGVTIWKSTIHTNGDSAAVMVTENSFTSLGDTLIDIGSSTVATWSGVSVMRGGLVNVSGTTIRGVVAAVYVDGGTVDIIAGLGVTDPKANPDQTVNFEDNGVWGILVTRGTVNVGGTNGCSPNLKCGTYIRNPGQSGAGWGIGVNAWGTSSVTVGEGVEISNSKGDGILVSETASVSVTGSRILGSGMNGIEVIDNAVVRAGDSIGGPKMEISGSGNLDILCGDSAIVHTTTSIAVGKIQCPKLH